MTTLAVFSIDVDTSDVFEPEMTLGCFSSCEWDETVDDAFQFEKLMGDGDGDVDFGEFVHEYNPEMGKFLKNISGMQMRIRFEGGSPCLYKLAFDLPAETVTREFVSSFLFSHSKKELQSLLSKCKMLNQ